MYLSIMQAKQLEQTDDDTRPFDAFISYSSQDHEFVADVLVPALETPERRSVYMDFNFVILIKGTFFKR